MWYLGIDGGGTKTAFVLGASDGIPVKKSIKTGCSYQSIGIENVVELLKDGVFSILGEAGISANECAGCSIGLPCYGEVPAMDEILVSKLKEALAPIPLKIVNDGVVGWAGSLECGEGIHLVAGTGSMAIGCSRDGQIARSGGWSEFFGDEGSCYWIGREGMSLFSKEADGRVSKAALYDIVKEEFALDSDFDFIEKAINEIIPYRDKVAAFQYYVLEAAKRGDKEAANLYVRAAKELAMAVKGVREQLSLKEENVKVSYAGGLFKAGDWIMKPLMKEFEKTGCLIQKPLREPVEGALLMAIKEFEKTNDRI